jgi:tRNA(Ile)-lysidine synthase
MSKQAIARVIEGVRGSDALTPPARVLALLSGGADSVCLLHALAQELGPARLAALHVNHGLRAGAAEDERFCAELCETLGVPLYVERVDVPGSGNLEARARQVRYAAAEAVRARAGFDVVATGHTGSDQAETVLYRLASSPGRRALLGMAPVRDRIVRPLLGVSREDARDYCRAAGLAWREDESNEDRTFARNRLRLDVLPALRDIHPAAEQNVIATASQLRDEQEIVERAIDEALERTGAGGHPPVVEAARLAAEPAAMRRLVLQRLAERAAGGALPLSSAQMREIERLAARGGSGTVELGAGVRAVAEYGFVRFGRDDDARPPEPAVLSVPGSCRFGDWELECLPGPQLPVPEPGSLDEPVLDAARLAPTLTVRAWRDGDRMRPLGLGGSKSLQDVFSDRKVPRGLRRALPVVVSGDEIAWVAGVAVSDVFKLDQGTAATMRLRARTIAASD